MTSKAPLVQPLTNSLSWDVPLNTNFGITSDAFGAFTAVGVTTTNVALTDTQAQRLGLSISGALTGDRNVLIPQNCVGSWVVYNGATGYNLSIYNNNGSGGAAGSGITPPTGYAYTIYSDGTNVSYADSNVVRKTGDTMVGALALPSNGLNVGPNQLKVSGGNVSMSGSLSVTGNTSVNAFACSSASVTSNATVGGLVCNGFINSANQITSNATILVNYSSPQITLTNTATNGQSFSLRNYVATATLSRFAFVNNNGTVIFYTDTNGNVTAIGTITANSDLKLKKNITTITNAMSSIKEMRGVYYDRIDNDSHCIGVIAQEVQKVFPELVSDNDGILSVAYGNMAGVFIEAIKELDQRLSAIEGK